MKQPAWWPLPDGEVIGEERAGELVAWLRTVAPAAVHAARVHLQRDATADIRTYAASARVLAEQALDPSMRGLPIGSVSRPGVGGATDTVGISLQRDGRLAVTIREPGEQVQRWVPIDEAT